MSFRAKVDGICAAFPGAVASDPAAGDLDSWKVGGKMFACFGDKLEGVAVKTASVEAAAMLIDAGIGFKAPYFHKSWIRVGEAINDDELAHRLGVSYDEMRSKLTKKAQADLAPRLENV